MKISISNFVEVMKKFTQVTLLLEVHTYRPQWLGYRHKCRGKLIKMILKCESWILYEFEKISNIQKKILNSLSWEKNSLINQSFFLPKNIYFWLICPIVQNKKTPIKIQCNHANNSRLRNLFVRILFLLLFNGNRGMKSLKENSCCGFVVAVLQSCVAWIFFPNVQKSPLWNQYYRFSYYMIDMENCWCFTVGDLLNGNECF